MSQITLSKEFEEIVRRQIERGPFLDAQGVVEAALRLLEDDQHAFDNWADEILPARHAELVANPELAVSVEDVRARLRAKTQAALSKVR
ncbi:putative addiction module antidote protein, CC2985 family [Ensifer adhaerens]|nr:putative addiction module antidote protein, CC2985 family [Ensifer adhaerens]HZG26901.1 type II toxin-antitoxin system ParD family antitoxin [Ensifer sp.]